jgi:hypothetical protein
MHLPAHGAVAYSRLTQPSCGRMNISLQLPGPSLELRSQSTTSFRTSKTSVTPQVRVDARSQLCKQFTIVLHNCAGSFPPTGATALLENTFTIVAVHNCASQLCLLLEGKFTIVRVHNCASQLCEQFPAHRGELCEDCVLLEGKFTIVRVVHNCANSFPPTGGEGLYCWSTCSQLCKRFHNCVNSFPHRGKGLYIVGAHVHNCASSSQLCFTIVQAVHNCADCFSLAKVKGCVQTEGYRCTLVGSSLRTGNKLSVYARE